MIYSIPIEKDDLIEAHRLELPNSVILETCESAFEKPQSTRRLDGEIVVMNFLEGGLTIEGTISGIRENTSHTQHFDLSPKQNDSLFGWEYSDESEVEVTVNLKLMTGQVINLLEKEQISLHRRFKQLLFYS